MTQLQTALLSPLKSLPGFFKLSLLFLSVLGVFFLSSLSPFIPFPKHSLPPPPLPHSTNAVNIKPHTEECDLFKGEWVPDPRGPLYNTSSCQTIPDVYKCFKHGRNDSGFLYWRWKPHQCELPRFDPYLFLELLRGKTLAFVGDSVARNHMESLLCLLSQAETPVNVYKEEGRHSFQTWNFPSTNMTLKVIWAPFLVKRSDHETKGTHNLHIDQINPAFASNLTSLNYVVVSIGHWLFSKSYLYNQTSLIGCIFCDDDPTTPKLTVLDAMRVVLHSALTYVDNCDECGDLVTVLRTMSPSHFENGPWNGGGYCNRTRPVEVEEKGRIEMELRGVQIGEIERVKRRGKKRFVGLDVTKVMLMRPDGHPGHNWPGKNWDGVYNDCIHWCMPGPVDALSEFLMEVFKRGVS